MPIKGHVRPLVLIASLLLTISCPVQPQALRGSAKLAAEDDIREVVLRYEMEGWYRGGDQSEKEAKTKTERVVAKELNFKIFFVSINGKDPTDAFIERFSDIPRIVRKVSRSEIGKDWRKPVLDRETGQRGIIFHADEIHWLDKGSVEVKGGYFCDGLCGVSQTLKLRRSKGEWVVTGNLVHRIF
jgi:hypothetical protein